MMGPALKETPWTFADFPVGETMAEVEIALTPEKAALWASISGAETPAAGDPAPRALMVAAMMETYIRALQPRPPGNVHAGQTLSFHGPAPAIGATLTARFACRAKAEKKGRFWITLGVEMFEGTRPALSGEILSIWAA